MDMQWWHWAVLGLVLGLFEIATPGGFFIVFFGLGAIVVSLLAATGVAGPLWVQWILFSAISVVSLLVFRDPLLRKIRASEHTGPIEPTSPRPSRSRTRASIPSSPATSSACSTCARLVKSAISISPSAIRRSALRKGAVSSGKA